MRPDRRSTLSFSLLELQRLRAAFDEMRESGRPPTPGRARTLRRLAAKLGAVAVSSCVIRLDGSDLEASLAADLLAHIGREESPRRRVVEALERLARDPDVSDEAKLRALTLLAELGAHLPEGAATLGDPFRARDDSLRELASYLGSAADVARAADTLLGELAADELLDFVDDLTEIDPDGAISLVEEMLLRDDIDDWIRGELRRLRAPLCRGPRRRAATRSARRATILLGSHADGPQLLLCSARRAGQGPARWRALGALLSADGELRDAHYRDDLTRGELEHLLADPLPRQGFRFAPATRDDVRELLVQGARAARAAGLPLPRGFYLGRDLLGVYDEHLTGTRRLSRVADLGALLARATDLSAAGEPARARPLLELYRAEAPDDPEGCASLGLCLLALGEAEPARRELQRAHGLEPARATHLWNLASASHRAGRPGACYLALLAYLDARDHDQGAEDRRAVAREFVADYERLVRLEEPGADPRAVAGTEGVSGSEKPAIRGFPG